MQLTIYSQLCSNCNEMGVKGLTTFVTNKSSYCMESFELHDTNLVIDGDAVLCKLYLKHILDRNSCFGGDYDEIANTIYKFFQMLSDCKVIPYVILDGGYECRKMETMIERLKNRLQTVMHWKPCFPLFLRETFEGIALKLKIKMVRCDFEGDREAASIAKALNCPVMSNDSDFFIYGVPYIPFLNIKMNVVHGDEYKYIECEMFRVDKFLDCIGCFDKKKLPLLSTLIGNDYSNGIHLSKLGFAEDNPNGNRMLHRIQALIFWLQKETNESAVEKILEAYEEPERSHVREEMKNAVNGYTLVESKYMKYLREDIVQDYDTSCIRQQDDMYNNYEQLIPSFLKAFMDNYRKSLYPTHFLDILTQNKYYNFKPQMYEISYKNHTHTECLGIMSAAHKILTGSSNNLVCLARIGNDLREQIVPTCELDLPSFSEIQVMDSQTRKMLLLRILDIDATFSTEYPDSYPESWCLFLFTLKFMMNRSVIPLPLVYSIILCKITLGYLDPQIGYFRKIDDFDRQYFHKISNLLRCSRKNLISMKKRLQDALSDITNDDALLAMGQLIPYFEMDHQLKPYFDEVQQIFYNHQSFDRHIVHGMGEFQSVFYHVQCLNQLLNKPFQDFLISECFNGTFIYNFTNDLKHQHGMVPYIKNGLRGSPIVWNCFKLIIEILK